MNIERAITYFAVLLVVAFLIIYTAGSHSKRSTLSSQSDTLLPTTTLAVVVPKATAAENANNLKVDEYEATLPRSFKTKVGVAADGSKPREQIANLGELDEYEATLPRYITTKVGVTAGKRKAFEQIADLRELAQYQATLPSLYFEAKK